MEQEHKQVIKVGATLFGLARKYTFNLMGTAVGLRLFHQYVSLILNILPDLMKLMPKDLKGLRERILKEDSGTFTLALDENTMEIIRLIPKIFSWERIEELAREMLAGCSVEKDGQVLKADDSGMGTYCTGDPLELYTAIVYGILSNYAPFFSADDDASILVSGQ